MPDEPRIPFRPSVRVAPARAAPPGFDRLAASGLTEDELAALDRALARLVASGMTERRAKLAIDAALRDWLEPGLAGEADLERLLAWR